MKKIIYSFKRLGGQRSVSAVGQGQPEEIKRLSKVSLLRKLSKSIITYQG